MEPHGNDHGGQGEGHNVHLPDPSFWPILVGVSAMLAGIGLIWWSGEPDSAFAGPLFGIGILSVLLSAGGWAYEDGRMRKKAEEGHGAEPAQPLYTQVLTFAIAEGQLDAARASGGVLAAVERTDLRDIEGFQDFRITVSPASAGPSQVLVETTWKGREGLATYESTRTTLLDTIGDHEEQVVPGTVQVFDMDVVRDTKDTSFKFGLPAAATLIGSLAIGGFAFGGGLTLFQKESTTVADGGGNGGETPAPTGPSTALTVDGLDSRFRPASISLVANADVKVTFANKGVQLHNIHFLDKKGGQELAPGAKGAIIKGGESEVLSFKTPGVGSYFYQCDVHPDVMVGTLQVAEAPAGGSAGGGAPGGPTINAADTKFDKNTLEATANAEFSITIKNTGKALHNLSFYDKKAGAMLAGTKVGTFLKAAESETITFKPPAAGTYYFQCDIHPNEMNGSFVVK